MKRSPHGFCCIALALLLSSAAAEKIFAIPVDNAAMIWIDDVPSEKGYLHVAFRKEFELSMAPATAELTLFAYTRYQLFINGSYVGRGPNRFENSRPEFDTIDVARHLRRGKNLIAVLVHRDAPSGRVQHHAPGLALRIESKQPNGTTTILQTDSSWQAFPETTYGPQPKVWSSFPEYRDARPMAGDWTSPLFDASALPTAAKVDTSDAKIWPALQPRTIPLLRETEIAWQPRTLGEVTTDGTAFTIHPGGELLIDAPQIILAYHVLEIEAAAGVQIEAVPVLPTYNAGRNTYITRAGRQRWILGDTWALKSLSLKVTGGPATFHAIRLVEVLYPFDRVGRFASGDPLLDRLWEITTRSVQIMSEDAYVDCSDRERVEWMDCDPPAYDVTRVALAGPGKNGQPLFSDARLMKNMLLRTALTQREDGMVKAHTCSDRWDVHAIMEDRACDWVDGLRKYYEATGDDTFITELWPRLERFLDWILAHRSPESGLVFAREWIVWDNPLRYVRGETTANNAFFQRALADGAFLASRIGRSTAAARFHAAAQKLRDDFNRTLWLEAIGAYASAAKISDTKENESWLKAPFALPAVDGLFEPTLHANLFALDRGIVPPERRDRVIAWTLAHDDQIAQVMSNHYYFKLLYSLDTAEADQRVLDRIRRLWKPVVDSPWQTTWEDFGKPSSMVHIYGAIPAHTLSTYVLGVRRDAPVWEKKIIIQPRLADLTQLEGTVSTEFGPVTVAWKKADATTRFSLTIPVQTTAELCLPAGPKGTVLLNGKSHPSEARGRWRIITLPGGTYTGVSE